MNAEITDSELVMACLHGDAVSERLLYSRFAAKMLGVCRRYAKSIEEAEDILQEGFVTVFTKLSQFRMEGSLEGWIRRIMVSRAIESYRKQSRIFPMTDMEGLEERIPGSDDVLNTLSAKDLLAMIDQLPAMQKIVFNLYIFEDMRHDEIAAKLKIPAGTSKSTLYYARLSLRKKINQSMLAIQNYEPNERALAK